MIGTRCAGVPRNACAVLGYGPAIEPWYCGIWYTRDQIALERARFERWKKRSVCISVNDACACEVSA